MLQWLENPLRLHWDSGPVGLDTPVCISPSGERVAWASRTRRTIRVNDVDTETELATISVPDAVEAMRFDDGALVMLGAAAIHCWSPESGLATRCDRPSAQGRLSRTGRWALFEVNGGLVRVDTRDGSAQELVSKCRGRAVDLAISDDGEVVARAVAKSVQVHRAGMQALRLEVAQGPAGKGMSFSPDARSLAVGAGDALHHCYVYDLEEHQPTQLYRDHFDPVYLAEGTLSCRGWHSAGCVLHIERGRYSQRTGVKMTAHCRSYSDDGSRLAVNTSYAGSQRVQVLAMPSAEAITGTAGEACSALAVGADTLVVDLNGRVTRYDAQGRERQAATHPGLCWSVAPAPDGTRAVYGGVAGIAMLDLATLELLWHDASAGRTSGCRFLPGGELVAIIDTSGQGRRSLCRLDPDTGARLGQWSLPEWVVPVFLRSVGLGWVSVAGRNGVVVLDVDGRPVVEWKVPPGGYLAALDEDGRHALVSSQEGDVRLWDASRSEVVASLAESDRVRRDLAFGGPWILGAANVGENVEGYVWSRTGALVHRLDWPVVESAGFIVQPPHVFLTSPTGVLLRYDPS